MIGCSSGNFQTSCDYVMKKISSGWKKKRDENGQMLVCLLFVFFPNWIVFNLFSSHFTGINNLHFNVTVIIYH
jgi:hypothetical protein